MLVIVGTIIVSCDKKSIQGLEDKNTKDGSLDTEQEILYKQASNYAAFFDYSVHNEVAYESSREHPLNNRNFGAFNKVLQHNEISGLAKSKEAHPQIKINGKTMSELSDISKNILDLSQRKSSNEKSSSDLDEFYGQDVTFSLGDKDVTMYMPQLVEILYPLSHEIYYPICYFDRYRLRWQSDDRNANGVVVIVEWDGSIFGEEPLQKYIRRIDIVEDNGETIIKPELFEGMPHLAITKVTILRGNIDIVEVQDISYKLYGSSDASLYTIIAKNDIQAN